MWVLIFVYLTGWQARVTILNLSSMEVHCLTCLLSRRPPTLPLFYVTVPEPLQRVLGCTKFELGCTLFLRIVNLVRFNLLQPVFTGYV